MNPTPLTSNTSPNRFDNSIDLMENTSPLVNNSLPYPTIKLPRIKIFETGFRKLPILSKFWE